MTSASSLEEFDETMNALVLWLLGASRDEQESIQRALSRANLDFELFTEEDLGGPPGAEQPGPDAVIACGEVTQQQLAALPAAGTRAAIIVLQRQSDAASARRLLEGGVNEVLTLAQLDRLAPTLKQEVGPERTRSPTLQARRTRALLEATFAALHDAVLVTNTWTRRILVCNPAVTKVLGYEPEDLTGRTTEPLFADKDTFLAFGEHMREALAAEGRFATEITMYRKGGTPFEAEVHMVSLSPGFGLPAGCVGIIRDVSRRKQAAAQQRLAQSVLKHSVEAVMITDLDRRIVSVNPAFERLTGYSAREAIGKTPDILRSGRHDSEFYKTIMAALLREDHWQGEIWHRRKNGEVFPAVASTSAVRDDNGVITHYTGIFSDISQHKETEQRLDFLAHHDPLTGLPNRARFEKLAHRVVNEINQEGKPLALLFLDVDNFKTVNETLGHALGDRLLQSIAHRLQSSMQSGDILARLSADEFGILLSGLEHARDAGEAAKRLQRQFRHPFRIEGHEFYLSACIGIACFPGDGDDVALLMKNADTAVIRAKQEGTNNYRYFSREMNEQAVQALVMANSLRHALERDELRLYLQPRVDSEKRRITGAEALVRWRHPKEGLLTPEAFVPMAEQSGLIGPLSDWVLQSALQALAQWCALGKGRPNLSVNLSARQFDDPELATQIRAILKESGAQADMLELEITESALMNEPKRTEHQLKRLRASGLRIIIDDFGTGYSSLNYLKHFPISGLKIDQSFVGGLPGDTDDRAITRTIIAVARSLDLSVVAEGVETESQADYLRDLGCEELQGYLFGRPMPVDDFLKLVAD